MCAKLAAADCMIVIVLKQCHIAWVSCVRVHIADVFKSGCKPAMLTMPCHFVLNDRFLQQWTTT